MLGRAGLARIPADSPQSPMPRALGRPMAAARIGVVVKATIRIGENLGSGVRRWRLAGSPTLATVYCALPLNMNKRPLWADNCQLGSFKDRL